MSLSITFTYEAGDTYESVIRRLERFTVCVTDADGNEIDAELVSSDPNGTEYGDVLIRRWNDEKGEGEGEPFSVRAENILVY